MIDIIIERIIRAASNQIVRDLAPVVTIAIENATRRHSRAKARLEVAGIVAIADAFADVVRSRLAGKTDGGATITLQMQDVVLFRRLEQSIFEYKEQIENERA